MIQKEKVNQSTVNVRNRTTEIETTPTTERNVVSIFDVYCKYIFENSTDVVRPGSEGIGMRCCIKKNRVVFWTVLLKTRPVLDQFKKEKRKQKEKKIKIKN